MSDERKNKLTTDQAKAAESEKKFVVVSASAGSGKTKTMVERVVKLIKEKGVHSREIAMMTFTEASAREMLVRLCDRLIEEIKETKGKEREALVCALDDLPFLSCGTIHSFCLRLIKSHFEIAGVPPAVSVTDEEAEAYIKKQAFKNLLKKSYEKDKNAFLSFTRRFEENKDEDLQALVFDLYDMMTTSDVREGYFDYAKAIASAPIEETKYASFYLAYFLRRSLSISRELESFLRETPTQARSYVDKTSKQIEFIKSECLSCKSLHDIFRVAERIPLMGRVSLSDNKNFPVLKERGDAVYENSKAFFNEWKNLLKGFGPFDRLQKDYADSAQTITEFIDFTQSFAEEYEAIKEKEKVLDYADLEKYALQLLEKEEIRKELGFRYVLVDECQDVNPVQDKIIRLISESGDLFTVGDVKQSIYRFRLADPELFNERMKRAVEDPDHSDPIHFDQNFRSSPAVIDFVNTVFLKIMTGSFGGVDYGAHQLVGRGPAPSDKKEGEVGVFFAPDRETETHPLEETYSVKKAVEEETDEEEYCPEGRWIYKKLQSIIGTKLFDAGKKEDFALGYRHVAILAAKRNGVSLKIIRYLQKKGIPLNLGDFLKTETSLEQDQLVDLFRLLLSPADDFALLSVLRSPIFGFTSEELAEIGRKEGKGFYEKARAFAAEPQGEKVKEAFALIEKTRFESSILSTDELALKIVRERFALPLLKEPDGRVRLGKLLSFARSLKGRKEAAGLAEFITYYDENEGITFSGEVQEDNAISVMTVHGSKGLEFPVVFLIGTGSSLSSNSDSATLLVDRDLGVAKNITDEKTFEKKKSFALECIKKKKREEKREDSLRLLYVALTRARNSLYVTGSIGNKRFNARQSTDFCSSAAEWIAYAVKDCERYPIDRVVPEEFDSGAEVAAHAIPEETDVSEILAGFDYAYPHQKSTVTGIKYTVTGINSTDEEGFYPPTPLFGEDKTQEGVAFHAVMENIPLGVETKEDVLVALDELVEQGVLTEEERKEISPALVLDAAKRISALTEGMKIGREKSFMMLLPAESVSSLSFKMESDAASNSDEVSVQGKIDLLAMQEGRAIVVDYKLSSAPASVLKERYRAQLDLYELAVRKAYGAISVKKYIFVLGRNELIEL